MKEWLRQYLVFSRKERAGLAVLLVLIAAVWLLPEFFGRNKKEEQALLRQADSIRLLLPDSSKLPADGTLKIYTLFRFDPNTLDEEGWQKLGLRPKTIGTIKNYLARGGRFRRAEDLARIYGLRPDESMRLMPYVDIPVNEKPDRYPAGYRDEPGGRDVDISKFGKKKYGTSFNRPDYAYRNAFPGKYDPGIKRIKGKDENEDGFRRYGRRKAIQPFDINLADTGMLVELPGIGSRLAGRIVQFREKLGGFYKIEQVAEIYGLQDSIYLLIRPFLLLNATALRKIPVNSAGFDTLNAHPYIQFAEARAIVQFRKQHGPFEKVEDLLKISILNKEWLDKVSPYLEIDRNISTNE
jgi:DNA uptake protein ComE-like DNA-binding protein